MPASTGSPHSRHLFELWRLIAPRLERAGHIALFLDFDGTLVPIRARPEEAEVSQVTRRLLSRLARHPHLTVCIISGRRAADIRKRVRVSGVRYFGLFGWERDGHLVLKPRTQELLKRTRRALRERLANFGGFWVEDKRPSFAVHYRHARLNVIRSARAAMREVLEPLGPCLRVFQGKKVWEILPQEIKGKGAAVRGLLSELAFPVVPIYIGDDITDESAFAAIPRGVTIRVGTGRSTRARFELRDPKEVQEFLEKLVTEIA